MTITVSSAGLDDAPRGVSLASLPGNVWSLSAGEQAVLSFEQLWQQRQPLASVGSKRQAIRQVLGLQWAQYYQILNQALEHPQALQFDPALVRHLQQHREHHRQAA